MVGPGFFYWCGSHRTIELPGHYRLSQDQMQSQDASAPENAFRTLTGFAERVILAGTGCARISNGQGDSPQRHQSSAAGTKARWPEVGYFVAQLAHAAPDTRYAISSGGRFAAGCSSAVGTLQGFNNARNLHPTDPTESAGSGRKTLPDVDECWRVEGNSTGTADAHSANSISCMVGAWGLEPQTSTVSR